MTEIKTTRKAAGRVGSASSPTLRRRLFDWFNKYTILKTTKAGNREAPRIERGDEERDQLKPYDRLNTIAMGRDLERNNSKAVTIIEQVKVLTMGRIKAQFNTVDDAWNEKASFRFNQVFGRDCWYKDDMNISEMGQLVEASKIREGDLLMVYDDFLEGEEGSGKVIIWEADQLVSVAPGDWESPTTNPDWRYEVEQPDGTKISKPYFQDSGVVTNRWDKVVAYIVTARQLADEKQHGAMTLPMSEVLVIPKERARLIKRRFRFGQRRGVAPVLPISEDLHDIDDMIKSELSTAKNGAKLLAWVKRKAETANAEEMASISKWMERFDSGEIEEGDIAAMAASEEALKPKRYKNLEEATGGLTEYAEEGDDIQIPAIDRPNLNTTSFYDHRGDSAGATLGLARGFTRMAVDNSYTGHRGETNMTWRHIRNRQKLNEWGWLDWLAVKVLERDIRMGELDPGPDGWKYKISWDYEKPDAIDEQKEAAAHGSKLKIGETNFRKLLGPSWKDDFKQLAIEIAFAKELGIPLSIFETVAGATATTSTNNDQSQKEE